LQDAINENLDLKSEIEIIKIKARSLLEEKDLEIDKLRNIVNRNSESEE
jgi:hypothetical protein